MNKFIGAAAAAFVFAAGSAFAQTAPTPSAAPVASPPVSAAPDYSAVVVKTTDLGKGAYMLAGAGGNMTLVVGKEGVLLVDTEFAPLHDKIKAAIAAISPLPIKYVVDTHYHGDHTGGNAAFAQDGALIVGQENLKKRMAEGVTNVITGAKTPPAPTAALPAQTYGEKLTLKLKGHSVKLTHIPSAHTDGDTLIYVPAANVIATGDIVSLGGRYPNVDISVGGGINGMIAGVDVFLKRANAKTKIVPGHGPLMKEADLEAYRVTLVTARDLVAAQIAAGKTEEETLAAKPLADLTVKVGATEQAGANFTRLVYRSLKAAP